MDKGQAWSMDLLIGVIIFMSMAVFFYLTFLSGLGQQTEFTNEGDLILQGLDGRNYPEGYNSSPVPLRGYSVSRDGLKDLYSSDYNTIQAQLGIQSEVCIFVTDRNGNLVPVESPSGDEQFSIGEGTEDVKIAEDLNCGE